MKKFSFLILVFISTIVFADDKKKESKFQLGLTFSPNLSYRSLFNSDNNLAFILDVRNENEVPKLGYTIGCNFIYNINKRIGIESGLQFANKGYKKNDGLLQFGNQFNPQSNIKYKSIYNFYFLDIPLKLNYKIGEKKLKKIISVGALANILLHNSAVLKQLSPTKQTTRYSVNTLNTFNFSPEIGFGLDYELSKKTNIRILPNFSYGIIKIVDGPIAEHLWQLGMQFSYFKKL